MRNNNKRVVGRIMLTANFGHELKLLGALENFGNIVSLRKRLFKRAFAKKVSIDLVSGRSRYIFHKINL